jgi:hypothetical protein
VGNVEVRRDLVRVTALAAAELALTEVAGELALQVLVRGNLFRICPVARRLFRRTLERPRA